MNEVNNKKGITLIALVITIIVLLILAGISISMLSGDNSILSRAAEAKEKSETSEIKEEIQLVVIGSMTDETGKLKDVILRNKLKNSLSGVTDNDITGNEKYGWQVKVANKAFAISKTGEVNEAFWEEVKDANGDITEIKRVDGTVTGLKIGDVIGYSAIDGVSSANRTITSYGTVTGTGENNDQIIEIDAGTWKILGVENGKLKIISDIVGRVPKSGETRTYASKVLKLYGKVGYQNAEEELNRICGLYGKGKYAENARSINVEDINKITGYDPEHTGINTNTATAEQIASGTNDVQEDNIPWQYGREVKYSWSGNADKKPIFTYEGRNTPETLTVAHDSFNWFNGKNWNISNYEAGKTGEICKLTSNYYIYYPTTLTYSSSGDIVGIATNSDEYKLLFDITNFGNGNDERYWLASRGVRLDFSYAGFGVRLVYGGRVSIGVFLASSDGYENEVGLGLRPVVFLKSDVQLKKDENGVWQFVEK